MPHVGELLAGRYRIDAPLGAGGNAVVYRAHDLRLRRDVAIKVLLPNLAQDSAVAHRFEREARSLAAVNHPGIVAVYDVEAGDPATDREPFFVMELCERGSLADLIAGSGGHLLPETLTPLIVDVAAGLASLHARGFVHRDVKPHNILLTPGGAKLGDLGIARGDDSTSGFTAPGNAIGTLAYLAPEILAGGPGSRASDMFALGAVVYEALTGRLPRPAGSVVEFVQAQAQPVPTVSEVRPELGTSFDDLVQSALDPDPAARPTPIQFAGALKAATAASHATGPLPRVDAAGGEPRRVRLAPPDRALASAGPTASIRLPPTGRTAQTDWIPQRRRRNLTGPLLAAGSILALAVLVAFAATDGFRGFGAGPGASTSPTPTDIPSSSPSGSPSPSPSPSPTPSASPTPSPTLTPSPPPTAAPTPTPFVPSSPGRTRPPFVDVATAQEQLRNLLTAIESAEVGGRLGSQDADDLRRTVTGIRLLVDSEAYQDAANLTAQLAAEIDRLEAAGDLENAGELRNVLGKLQAALPPPTQS